MPTTIGSLIISAVNFVAGTSISATATAFTVGGTAITTGQIVGTIALTAASLAIAPKLPSPTAQKIPVKNAVAPRRRFYGRVRIYGVLGELKISYINGGDGILYVLSMIASHEIDAIEEHRFNDQVTRVDGSGQVTFPAVWLDVNRVQVHYQLGTNSQVADTLLTAAFPGRWTSTHQLNGIAYSVGKFNGVPLEDFSTVYQAGVPQYSATIRGAKVYDPRESAHDWDDPSTWEYSENAALIIMDYLWHADGMRLPRSLIANALDDWIVQANICDEQIELISGETGDTEARYRLCGGYAFDELPRDVLARMLAPIDGRVRLREDSAIVLEVGQFTTPSSAETFTDDDIIAYTDFRRGPAKTELKNEIRAIYTSPGHDFQAQEADPLRDEDSIDLDGLQSLTLQLDMCPSHAQARRRMKVESYIQNPDWMGTVITNARGMNMLGKRYMHLTISDLGIDTTFRVQKANIDILSGQCTFEVVAFPAAAYDWEAVEEGISPESETPGTWGIAVPSGTTSVIITADGAGGGGENGGNGGGGGARSIKTIAVDPLDWGQVIQFIVGAGGIGDPQGIQSSTNGGNSTVSGTLVAGVINMMAGGGSSGFSGGVGGTASGGDTNTAGGNHSGGNGGTSAAGAIDNGLNKAESPGGGGHEWADGGDGRVIFDWTYA